MLIIVSFGLNKADNVIARACVPDINWALTNASSALKTCAYISSILFRPDSSIPYPVDEFKCISCKLQSWNASITFILFWLQISSIFSNCGCISFSTSFANSNKLLFII